MRPSSIVLALALVPLWFSPTVRAAAPDRAIRFARRDARVGDRAHQEIDFEVNLIIAIRQHGQTIHTRDQGNRQRQSRDVSVLEVRKGLATKARVDYGISQQISAPRGEGADENIRRDPVAGKSYLVAREAADRLIVTDLQGNRPPETQRAIVARNMDALGRPNPLADYFDRRVLAIGQTVALPREVANELLGFEKSVGTVNRFDLTLVGTRKIGERQCALFHARIEFDSPLADDGHLTMQGELLLDTSSCRIASLALSCPLRLEETRGPEGGQFQVRGTGSLQIAMRSTGWAPTASTSR